MISGLPCFSYRNFYTPCKIILGIAGVAFLIIALPFLKSRIPTLLGRVTFDKAKPKTPIGNWRPVTAFFKTPFRTTIYYEFADPNKTVADIVSEITDKALKDRPNADNIFYLEDTRLFCGGKIINPPGTEYMFAHEFIQTYKLPVNSVQLIFRQSRDNQAVEKISRALKDDKELSQLCKGCDTPLVTIQLFRVQLHSYCDRIFRGKFDLASLDQLKKFDEGLLRVLKKYPRDQKIQEYFNGLRASLAVVLAWYLESFEAIEQHIQSQLKTLTAPSKAKAPTFTFTVAGTNYAFDSLQEVIKHSQYFDIIQEFFILDSTSVQKVSDNHFSLGKIPDVGVDPTAFDFALQYLQGVEIQDYIQSHPWEVHSAALFLQISRLLLLCEKQLLQDLKNNKLKPNSLPKPLDNIKFEMPCLYKGMEMKGWKLT